MRSLSDILDFKNFKCIITSRPTYINTLQFNCIIELKPFDSKKIEKFYKIVIGNDLKGTVDNKNIDVFGIPVILYMAIMSNINITKNTTKPKLYRRIFAERGGIFDKFSYEGVAYSEGSHILRDHDNIEKYLNFLRKVAFDMFEKSDLSLIKKECEIPELEFQGIFISVLEFPLKHLFENAEVSIEFIHKSIYEFFVSEYLFKVIYDALDMPCEYLACVFGEVLGGGILSLEIIEFLWYRFNRYRRKMKNKFEHFLHTFELMMKDGMTYYSNKRLKMVLHREAIVFVNMLHILHFWKFDSLHINPVLISYYIRNNSFKLDLRNISLMRADLKGVNLDHSRLKGANLRKTDLRRSNLRRANLKGANLCGADLRGADLREANLEASIWYDSDIKNALSQIKETFFETLQIRSNDGIKQVSRGELFSNEDRSSAM